MGGVCVYLYMQVLLYSSMNVEREREREREWGGCRECMREREGV